ncbi:hypothetical protein [Streptomyces niveus]|uniref:hypothetical protein n=1 Tax=Streptomyces niveus TaxID=193462 RepID=UPI003443D798
MDRELVDLWRKGMRQLARRLRLVPTGALGRGVTASAEPGCEHKADRLVIGLSLSQVTVLTGRIAAAPRALPGGGAAPESAGLSSAVGPGQSPPS